VEFRSIDAGWAQSSQLGADRAAVGPGRALSLLWARQFPRPAFYALLVLVGFANGISEIAYHAASTNGWVVAAFQTFDVSIILWVACGAAVVVLSRASNDARWQRGDVLIGVLAAITFLVPVPAASWLGLSILAIYLGFTATDPMVRRAAPIILAMTVPLFWARIVFAAFSETILRADAWLVGWIMGVAPVGNAVPLGEGSGWMFIAPACSSLANLSLAFLSAVLFVGLRSGIWTLRSAVWALVSAAAVVLINVTRISLIGLYPEHYLLIHGVVGTTFAGWLTLIGIVAIGYHRIGNDYARGDR